MPGMLAALTYLRGSARWRPSTPCAETSITAPGARIYRTNRRPTVRGRSWTPEACCAISAWNFLPTRNFACGIRPPRYDISSFQCVRSEAPALPTDSRSIKKTPQVAQRLLLLQEMFALAEDVRGHILS